LDCLFNKIANNNPWIRSAYFLKDNNLVFILTSIWFKTNSKHIKVSDCKDNKMKEINDSNDGTFLLIVIMITNYQRIILFSTFRLCKILWL
jgi:hypothetical protein